MEHTIKIIGYSRMSAVPDKIRLRIKIENMTKEYCEAMEYAEKAQHEMIEVVKRANLAESELKTLSWGITAEYSYHTNERNEQMKVFDGYRYRHSFVIELGMDHKVAGGILNEIVQSSLTPEIGLEYVVSNPETYKDKLLEDAVADSKCRRYKAWSGCVDCIYKPEWRDHERYRESTGCSGFFMCKEDRYARFDSCRGGAICVSSSGVGIAIKKIRSKSCLFT